MYIDETNETVDCIKKEEDGKVIHIPIAPNNRHYQEYLEWLAQGNEPEPADEVIT
jgi:hypothetical protein